MNTHEDNFEFAVSQAVDDVLGDLDRRALGDRLTAGPAVVLAAEHERVNSLVRAHAARPEGVDFDAFADAFSATLAAEDAYVPAALPIRPTWTRRFAGVAAVILVGLAAWPFLPHKSAPNAAPAGEAVVQINAVAAPTEPVINIAVGPSETMVKKGLAGGLDTKPVAASAAPKVVISSEPTGEVRPY